MKTFTLKFEKSRSARFNDALRIAKKLGGDFDGKEVTIIFSEIDLVNSYDALFPLFEIVSNWKSLAGFVGKKPVNPYTYVLKMKFMADCATERNNKYPNMADRHCWDNPYQRGWGCKLLAQEVSRHIDNNHRNYWYEFGYLENGEWVIDKKKIYRRLLKRAEETGVIVCPFFDKEALKRTVMFDLPDRIKIDHVTFTNFGDKIRHVIVPPDQVALEQHRSVSRVVSEMYFAILNGKDISEKDKEQVLSMDSYFDLVQGHFFEYGVSLN